MRKSSLIVLVLVIVAGCASLLLLNRYKTQMIHLTIRNAVVQKAPENYPTLKINERFDAVFQRAQQARQLDAYLDRLLALAQRLEKVQHLEPGEIDALLLDLDIVAPSSPN